MPSELSKLKALAQQDWRFFWWLVWPLVPLGADQAFHPDFVELLLLLSVGFLLMHGTIALHELGHLVMGRVGGLRHEHLQIGRGWRIIDFKIGGLRCVWCLLPNSGYVRLCASSREFMLWPKTLSLLGGALAEIFLLVLVWRARTLPAVYASGLAHDCIAYAWMFLLIHTAVSLVAIFRPGYGFVSGQQQPNDSLQLLTLWRERDKLPARCRAFEVHAKCADLQKNGRLDEVPKLLAQLLTAFPDDADVCILVGHRFSKMGDLQSARSAWETALAIPPARSPLRAAKLDILASYALANPSPAVLIEADIWSDEALQCDPAAVTLKGTRGSVLITLGRFDEGRPYLEETISQSTAPHDQAISRAYLARAAFLQGDRAKALSLFAEIRALKIEHELISVSKRHCVPLAWISRLEYRRVQWKPARVIRM